MTVGLVALAATSCVVPVARYDEARSALMVEREGHRRTHVKMYELERRLDDARREIARRDEGLQNRDKLLQEHERLLAQSELDLSVASSDREAANLVVDQLRDELSRVATHLRAFAEQKESLEQALEDAEARADRLAEAEKTAALRALVVRDLSLALHAPISTGFLSFNVDSGRAVVRIPTDRVFVDGSESLSGDARAVLATLVKVALARDGTSVEVTETNTERSRGIADNLLVRLERVAGTLTEVGLPPGRVVVAMPPVQDDRTETTSEEERDPTDEAYLELALLPPVERG